jgi:cytochrome c556
MKTLPVALLIAGCLVAGVAGCAPKLRTPIDDIPKLTSLDQVMDNQATAADPQMGKAGETTYSDADWTAFGDVGTRIQATAKKIKDFSKGPDFDALADQLGTKAKALADAAGSKDAAKASSALGDMKATCKACHSKFR